MNKKAFIEAFSVLIAVAIIATAFFIFYTWYGFSEKGISFKINEKTADFKDSNALITLLSTPVGNMTIADLIVTGNSDAILAIEHTLRSTYGSLLKYKITMGGNIVAETSQLPQLSTKQETIIPVPFKKPAKIIMEFGI